MVDESSEDVRADWDGSADAAQWSADGSHEVESDRAAEWRGVVDAAWEQMMNRPGWAPVA